MEKRNYGGWGVIPRFKVKAMNTYFKVIATIEGETEILFGSFVKADCSYELKAERDSWKEAGYKNIKIISEETKEVPDKEVYRDQICTSHELFLSQAPSFNFEKNEEELLEHALEVGYVSKIEGANDQYLINQDY